MKGVQGVQVVQGVQGVQGFGVFGVRVDDILEGQKGDQGGGPKMAKILGGAKFQHFGPRLRPKKSVSNR